MSKKEDIIFGLYLNGKLVGYETHTFDEEIAIDKNGNEVGKVSYGNIFHKSIDGKNQGLYGTSIVAEGESYFISHNEKRLIKGTLVSSIGKEDNV